VPPVGVLPGAGRLSSQALPLFRIGLTKRKEKAGRRIDNKKYINKRIKQPTQGMVSFPSISARETGARGVKQPSLEIIRSSRSCAVAV
jgi:hypothetical protein